MSSLRFQAVENASSRANDEVNKVKSLKSTSIYGNNVFTIAKMKEYLPKTTYKELKQLVEDGSQITRELAEHIAQAMKTWALVNETTHYTHWFQPLTGSTAEKPAGIRHGILHRLLSSMKLVLDVPYVSLRYLFPIQVSL